jgi:DNA-binding response OmpR family regulator
MPGLATEAGQKAVELKPDLILMDVGLPALSGSANSPSYSEI